MSKILLYNRKTKLIKEEQIFEENLTKFLYTTAFGFLVSEYVLKWKFLNLIIGIFQNTAYSRKKIDDFIKKYAINTEEILEPLESFKSFNDFFVRKLKPSSRPISSEKNVFIAPADSRLLAYHIQDDLVVPVKGKKFTINELLKDVDLSAEYKNGICLVFRLAPIDYHRFCYIDNCLQLEVQPIKGFYRAVVPFSLMKCKAVFTENYREYCVLQTENFGKVLHIDVGALGVGKIVQHNYLKKSCIKGEEKGYFEFGGSTIILLVKEGIIKLDKDIEKYSLEGIETVVQYGERIGIGDVVS